MSTAMKVTFAPDRIALRPGESAEVEVTIQNASQVVEHFATSVVGLPRQDLFTCEPPVVMLRPRDVGTVRVRITVPERGGLLAGPYVLGLLVRSPYQREVSRCEELPMDVRATPALDLRVQPEVVTGGSTGDYSVSLTNDGNQPLAVTLAGSDQENRVSFDFTPRELFVEPGMATGARLTVHATAPMTGQEVRRALTLRAHAGQLTVERPVAFLQRPRIAGGLLKVGGMAAGLLVLAGATVGGAMLIRDAKQPDQTQQPPATTAPATTEPTPTSGGQLPPGAKTVDFTRLPDGQPPGDRIIDGALYAASGVTLSSDVEKAPPDCRDATAVALRTTGGYGSFLTSARPAGAALCNTMPVRLEFAAPVRLVRLTFTGDGASYTMTVKLSDGSTETREAASQTGTLTPVSYEAPAGSTVTSVTFGHTNPDPTTKEPTIIKSITFTTE